MKEKQRGKIDIVIIALALLLFMCVTVICVNMARMYLIAGTAETVSGQAQVYAAARETAVIGEIRNADTETVTDTSGQQAVSLSLHSSNPEENVPFRLTNMFPGDRKTQYYRVSVSYTGTITVIFQASAQEGGEKLGEVLEARVKLINTDEVLYEGILADMPQLKHVLTTDSETQTEELYYEITVGLSTSVGNEYQNKSLAANLSWWAEGIAGSDEPENPTEPSDPEGEGDPTAPSAPEGEDDPTEPTEPASGDDADQSESTDNGDAAGSEGGSLTDPPNTGDDSRMMMWLMSIAVTMTTIILVLVRCRRNELPVRAGVPDSGSEQLRQTGASAVQKSRRKLFLGIFLAAFLILGWGITSLALVYQKVTVEENLFVTGSISISLNDDKPVFDEDMLFEPGMVVKKNFTLRNDGTDDVYYRLYFTNIDGDFAEVLAVEITGGEHMIFQGTLADMNGEKSEGADGLLLEGEEREMTITFRVPEDCGNVMQGRTVLFDLNADAVQAVNNPSQLFE